MLMDVDASSPMEGLRILVVEDMLLVADEIEHLLGHFGCEVVGPVMRVADALAAIKQRPPDGALLDVNLNGETGYAIADDLFKRGIPFIFMTGYDINYLLADYRGLPCIQKPFTADELRTMMEKIFAHHAVSAIGLNPPAMMAPQSKR